MGSWVDVKVESATILRKELKRAKTKGPVTIFMSSSTDPYQPVEAKEEVTRALLEVMVSEPPDFLLVQTRSPLVRRDVDLLQQLGERVRVSMTVETDREEIRKHFTPSAPPIQARLKTLESLRDAGIPAQALLHPCFRARRLSRRSCGRSFTACASTIISWGWQWRETYEKTACSGSVRGAWEQEWYDPAAYQMVYDRFSRSFRKSSCL